MADLTDPSGKACPQCKRMLFHTELHRDRRRVDGLAFYCKTCANERSAASRRKRGIAPQKKSPTPVGEGLKWCPDCEQIKPRDDFPTTTTKASGRHSYCKPATMPAARRRRSGSTAGHANTTYNGGTAWGRRSFRNSWPSGAGSARSVGARTRNIWTTIIAPDGCAGYSASTATVVLASSVTVP
ncbi:hypothetical protein GCM10028790_63640 [Micromonospora taraxaci]